MVQVLMLELIREHQSLFPRDAGPCPVRPVGKPQDPMPAPPSPPGPPGSPCARQLSLPLMAERWGRPGSVSSLRDTREPPSPPPHPPQSASKHWDQRLKLSFILCYHHTEQNIRGCPQLVLKWDMCPNKGACFDCLIRLLEYRVTN